MSSATKRKIRSYWEMDHTFVILNVLNGTSSRESLKTKTGMVSLLSHTCKDQSALLFLKANLLFKSLFYPTFTGSSFSNVTSWFSLSFTTRNSNTLDKLRRLIKL